MTYYIFHKTYRHIITKTRREPGNNIFLLFEKWTKKKTRSFPKQEDEIISKQFQDKNAKPFRYMYTHFFPSFCYSPPSAGIKKYRVEAHSISRQKLFCLYHLAEKKYFFLDIRRSYNSDVQPAIVGDKVKNYEGKMVWFMTLAISYLCNEFDYNLRHRQLYIIFLVMKVILLWKCQNKLMRFHLRCFS